MSQELKVMKEQIQNYKKAVYWLGGICLILILALMH
jgi:hypothetical protein